MRKFLVHLAMAAVAAMSLAGVASATSDQPDGTIITSTATSNIALGGVITCSASTVKGSVSNNAAGAGADLNIAAGTAGNVVYSGCGSGNSVTPAGNWTLHPTSNSGTQWFGTVSGVDVTVSAFGGLATCRYTGTLSGGNYDNNGGVLSLSGTLTKASGGFLCPASGSVSGTYAASPAIQLS